MDAPGSPDTSKTSGSITVCGSTKEPEKQSVAEIDAESQEPNRAAGGVFHSIANISQAFSKVFPRQQTNSDDDDDDDDDECTAIVRPLDKFTRGYPNLAAFHDSEENFMIYRRFGYLQSRVLLERQDKLRLLELKLDEFDEQHEDCAVSREPNDETADDIKKRSELLETIDGEVQKYAASLSTAQQLMGFNRPSSSEQKSVQEYLDYNADHKYDEKTYIKHKEDLVTLRPGREHAWLDRCIEDILRALQRPFPFIHLWFSSKETRQKISSPKALRGRGVYFYTRSRIQNVALSILIATMLGLLIIPVWLLYRIVLASGGTLAGHENSICIAIMLVSTLLFSAVLALFTQGRRHELFAAAATYCALLVFFFGTVNVT